MNVTIERKLRRRTEQRIFYPPGSWIKMHNDVFKEIFPKLKRGRSANLYIALYDRCLQVKSRQVALSLRALSELINSDERTARQCIIELVGEGFIKIDYAGKPYRSRTSKTTFRVPLSELVATSDGWVPVPRILIERYLKVYPNGLLLIVLLSIQHYHWKNRCWIGVAGLQKIVKWSKRTIYHALHVMGHQHQWGKLDTNLPWPLKISYSNTGTRRFSVRAVKYFVPTGHEKTAVRLSKEFATRFYKSKTASDIDKETDD